MTSTYDIKLKEITIPKTVETITDMSFSMCTRLESVKFEGNAPSTFKEWDPVAGEISDPSNTYFFVYCHEEAEGFTSPEWNGYPTAIW